MSREMGIATTESAPGRPSAIGRLLNADIEGAAAAVLVAIMVVVAFQQVVFRYVLQSSLVWSEELTRYLFVWTAFVASAYAAKEGRHLSVVMLIAVLPRRVAGAIELLADLLSLAFCGYCAVYGWQMVEFLFQTVQLSPGMQINVGWVYLAIPVGMSLTGLRILQRRIALLLGHRDRALEAECSLSEEPRW